MRFALLTLFLATACCRAGGSTTDPTTPPPTPPPTDPTTDPTTPPTPPEPPKDPGAVCQKDRPCDAAAPPKCTDSPRPKTLDDVFASGDKLGGATVTVAAPLHPGPMRCTRMACSVERPCCNRCGSGMVLAVGDPNQGAARMIFLQGEGLDCSGDDSGVCCPVSTGGRAVMATGTLRVQGDATTGFTYLLEGARLCAP